MDRQAITTSLTQFLLFEDHDTPTLRAVTPFKVSTNFRGTNCLSCHHVQVGSVNGAASITLDMTEDFNDYRHTKSLLITGQIALQILLFISISWMIRRFMKPIRKLQATMASMRVSGSTEQFVPIKIKNNSQDEIGKLTEAFNQMSEALSDSESSMKLASSIYVSNANAIVVTDENNLIVDVNPAFTRITGRTKDEVLGKDPKFMSSGRHSKEFYSQMWKAILSQDHWEGEIWDKHKDGSAYVKSINIVVLRHKNGSIYRYVAQFSDITEQKAKDDLIYRQANYDTLTNLPNRRLFYDRLGQAIKLGHRTSLPVALLFIDLDRFKEINDTLGHAAGDKLLIEAAQRICSCVREADTVSRLGGDEFTVILPEIGDIAQAKKIAQKIVQEMTKPFFFKNNENSYQISASIGVSVYPLDAESQGALIHCADNAMYSAKAAGRNCFICYSESNTQPE
jgi:diguanylate cyclase (GGDEF)-like protein/PAS domain S-box-containing protein